MTEDRDPVMPLDQPAEPRPPAETPLAVPAGFRRRVLAGLIDALVLAILGAAIGYLAFDFWVAVGSLGKLLGFVAAFAYRSFFHSERGGGSTFGKRLLGLRVVDGAGELLSYATSARREVFLGGWYFLLPALAGSLASSSVGTMGWLVGSALSLPSGVLGISTACLALLNRPSRQTPHDLFAGSYVVKGRGDWLGLPQRAPVRRLHMAIIAALCLVPMVGVASLFFALGVPFQALAHVGEAAGRADGVRYASGVTAVIQGTPQGARKIFSVVVVPVGRASDDKALAEGVVRQLGEDLDVRDFVLTGGYDTLVVTVQRQFDLGIFQGNATHSYPVRIR